MKQMRTLIIGLGALALASTACTDQSGEEPAEAATALDEPESGLSRVIMVGDSVAAGQALPLGAAFDTVGVEFHSMASDGGGNAVGPNAEALWEDLPERIETAKPSTVIYQITTYDWGEPDEQREAYERLVDTAAAVDATLVFVTPPPIVPDDFYEPHMPELEHATEAAFEVAESSRGQAIALDAEAVWGEEYQQERDGKADRSSDGIHTCPQGAARFTQWLLEELTAPYPDFTPPAAEDWANAGWSGDDRFKGC